MRIIVFTICRNEQVIMPYFLRHYSQFTDRIVIFDDKSTDETREIVRSFPGDGIELRGLGWDGIDDELAVKLWQECKLEAHADGCDWAICVDADEFVYHPRLSAILQSVSEDAVKLEGWQMLADHSPRGDGQIYEEISCGLRDDRYDKTILFRPGCDITWDVGRHYFFGQCSVKEDSGITLDHFRYFGEQYAVDRAAEHAGRLSENNKAHGWGGHVLLGSEHQSVGWFKEAYKRRQPLCRSPRCA